jgi:hypothetical protein
MASIATVRLGCVTLQSRPGGVPMLRLVARTSIDVWQADHAIDFIPRRAILGASALLFYRAAIWPALATIAPSNISAGSPLPANDRATSAQKSPASERLWQARERSQQD